LKEKIEEEIFLHTGSLKDKGYIHEMLNQDVKDYYTPFHEYLVNPRCLYVSEALTEDEIKEGI